MKAVILHNPRCRKSREALALLTETNVEFEIRAYLEDPLNRTELEVLFKKLDLPIERVIRKNEAIFKEKFKGKAMDRDAWLTVLVEYPKLLERPILIMGDQAAVGRPPEAILPLLNHHG